MSFLNILSILTAVLDIGGKILINYKKKSGFIVWTVSNTLWIYIVLASPVVNYGMLILFSAYICINFHGLYKWNKEEKLEKLKTLHGGNE